MREAPGIAGACRSHSCCAPEPFLEGYCLGLKVGQLKGDARASLHDPNYDTLKLRLEAAHSALEAAAVEARRRVRLNEGR
jgi:hypothetical protein